MREIPLLFIALVMAIVLCQGCIQTPANVANEVPGVLSNVSGGINNITLPVKISVSVVTPTPIPERTLPSFIVKSG